MTRAGYEIYTDLRVTGEHWLGDVPSNWKTTRLKNLFQIRKQIAGSLGFDVLSVTQRGVKLKDVTSGEGQLSMDYSKYQLVDKDDFVMNHMDLLTGFVDISPFSGVTSPDYRVFIPRARSDIHPRFYLYILQLCYLNKIFFPLGQGSAQLGRWRLPTQEFHNFILPVPNRDEQARIAEFLDYETVRIDALIEKQQQLIALLKEKRQAVISHAVTKGLNPDAPLRDSGVEWLGMVPAHWRVMQLRHCVQAMEQGKSPECESREANLSEWGVLKTGCVNGGVFHPSENKALPGHMRPFPEYEVKPYDVLMSRASGSPELIGSVAFVTEVRRGLLLSDKIFRVSLSTNVAPRFFTYLMQSSAMRTLIVRSISGAEGMANNITKAAVLSFKAPVPPLEEQKSIVQHIEKAAARLEQLVDRAGAMLSILSERRTALISAAVTGKIDVRNWSSPDSDVEQDVA